MTDCSNKYAIVLITSRTYYVGLVRSLKKAKIPVIVAVDDPLAIITKTKYVDDVIVLPSNTEEDAYLQALIGLADRYAGSWLLPPSDDSLAIVSRHKKLLSQYFKVSAPDWEHTKLFLDKRYTYEIAEKLGVPHPKTRIPANLDDVIAYAEVATFPCLIKPRQIHIFRLHFHEKMFIAHNVDELVELYEKTSVVDYNVMLQEFIPGTDGEGANYNSYFVDGQPIAEFTAKKIRNAPPQTGSPRVLVTQYIPELIEPGRKILQGLNYDGFSCIEFKRDPRDGVYKLMEVNGRHNLSSLLAVQSGMPFPEIEYRHVVEGIVPTKEQYPSFEEGVYWSLLLSDLSNSIRHYRQERYPLMDYLRPYLGKTVIADVDLRDLGPLYLRIKEFVRKIFRNSPHPTN